MGRSGLVAALALAAAFSLGLLVSMHAARDSGAPDAERLPQRLGQPGMPEIGGYVLPEPEPLGPFALVDDALAPFGPDALRGRWSFLYFGYTYCPDVCPLTLAQMAVLAKQLAARCSGLDARYYLVSVDPERDTPERLREYVRYFGEQFRGVTGAAAELEKLADEAGAFYALPEDRSGGDYLVGHSSTVTIVDPGGNLHAVLTAPHTGERMADDFAAVLAHYRERHADYAGRCEESER